MNRLEKSIRERSGGKRDVKGPPTGIRRSGDSDNEELLSLTPRIHSLDQLLKKADVDLTVWEVERYVANKWEVGMKMKADDGRTYVLVEPLWQVKAWLRRKAPIVRAVETLLADLQKNAPLLPKVRVLARRKHQPRRSLEVSLMDPHTGLVTAYPEGDSSQTLDSIGSLVMTALEDLIQKASVFGPFEEVFMPFGNDFLHVDNIFHTTTAGTNQPEAESWHRIFLYAEKLAIRIVERLRQVAPVFVYEVPGNHSRQSDFALARILNAWFHNCDDVTVDASSSPYKFHRFGTTLIGYEHGHSVKPIRLAALMANERKKDWMETTYREWHLGDQHRKGSSKPSMLEEQGVSVEYIPGLTAPNEWHRLKGFNHQKRGAMAFVYDHRTGPVARLQFNIQDVQP